LVSHDMDAIKRLCSKCIRLEQGHLVETGEPEDVVQSYLNDALMNQLTPSKKYQSNQISGSSRNEIAEIFQGILLSEKMTEIGAVKIDEEFFIKIIYHISISNVQIIPTLDIYAKGILVFRSIANQDYFCPEPGTYEATIQVPANILTETQYSINAGLRIHHAGKQTDLVAYDIMSFKTYNPRELMDSTLPLRKRNVGVMKPILSWQFSKMKTLEPVY